MTLPPRFRRRSPAYNRKRPRTVADIPHCRREQFGLCTPRTFQRCPRMKPDPRLRRCSREPWAEAYCHRQRPRCPHLLRTDRVRNMDHHYFRFRSDPRVLLRYLFLSCPHCIEDDGKELCCRLGIADEDGMDNRSSIRFNKHELLTNTRAYVATIEYSAIRLEDVLYNRQIKRRRTDRRRIHHSSALERIEERSPRAKERERERESRRTRNVL